LPLTVEQVLRSDGEYGMYDIYDKYGPFVEKNASRLYWQARPQAGVYCVYQKRATDPSPLFPDCVNVSQTLTRHAGQLTSAGVDYVAMAATNLATVSPFSDLIQQRPTEVVADHWAALRQQGVPTPRMTVWNTIHGQANVWESFLSSLFNNATVQDLLLRDTATGKKVFLVPFNSKFPPNETIRAALESNSGRDDIVTQDMWANLNATESAGGRWSFMGPCGNDSGNRTAVTGGVGLAPCGQGSTTNAKLGDGTAVSVNPSYQLGYSSLPLDAAGKLDGLTLKRQFSTAIRSGAQWVFMSAWNEWCAQDQSNPWHDQHGSNTSFSQGLPYATDPDRFKIFVDTFGTGISRDLEPSVAHGTQLLDIVASCVRVMRLQRLLNTSLADPSDVLPCTVAGEECCTYRPEAEAWLPAWSLRRASPPDVLVTTNSSQVKSLLSHSGGSNYTEMCAAFGVPTPFCVDGGFALTTAALQGPFQLRQCAQQRSPQASVQPGSLFTCDTAGRGHAITLDGTCRDVEGIVGSASVVGCVDPSRTSTTPRALFRCLDTDLWTYVLDSGCGVLPGATNASLLGRRISIRLRDFGSVASYDLTRTQPPTLPDSHPATHALSIAWPVTRS
jgi:hypothetical protein